MRRIHELNNTLYKVYIKGAIDFPTNGRCQMKNPRHLAWRRGVKAELERPGEETPLQVIKVAREDRLAALR